MNTKRPLDRIDWEILRYLQQNARISYSQLGRRLGLTPPAIAERVQRMEAMSVIEGFHAEINTSRLGFPLTAFIRVSTNGKEQCSQFGAVVPAIPNVLECHRVSGDYSYILKTVASSARDLEKLVDRLLTYGQPSTSIVLSSPVTRRVIVMSDDASTSDDSDADLPHLQSGDTQTDAQQSRNKSVLARTR